MCYNVTYLEKRALDYHERYRDLIPEFDMPASFPKELPVYHFVSGFEHPVLPIVKYDGIYLFEWGLIPAWVKDERQAKEMKAKTLNAIGETVFEKPSFRTSIKKKRCLFGVNGFFEWRDLKGVKYPYHIRVAGENIFSLGCIYETWVNRETAEIHNTFSIVTTPANPMMEKIHNLKKRMPLIIDRKDEAAWIDPGLEADEVKALIKTFPQEKMTAITVDRMVNSARNNRNVPEACIQMEYAELRD